MDWGIFFVTTASNWLLLMFDSFEKGRRFASCYRIAKNILPIYWLSGSRRRVGISNWLFVWLRSWWRRSWRSIVFLRLNTFFKSLNPILNLKFFVVCKRMQLTIVVDYFFLFFLWCLLCCVSGKSLLFIAGITKAHTQNLKFPFWRTTLC